MNVSSFCLWTQVQQNINVAVNEYTKLKQQLEKNAAIIKMLEYLKEVNNVLVSPNGYLHVSVFEISCVTQFHSAMEEFNKALQEKKYVNAANHLDRVRATYIYLRSELELYMKSHREIKASAFK